MEELLREGVLVSRSQGARRSIFAPNSRALESALGALDERLANLDVMKGLLIGDSSRAEQAATSGNSKLVQMRSCPGFPVNCYERIDCTLGGQSLVIAPAEGTFLFVANWKGFIVPEDVVIVGVENMENFRQVSRSKVLFESLLPGKRLLFVSRYPQSTDLRSWLQGISNPYVHFGDFDLAGINIFQTEFQKYLGERATFLIPGDIERRLQGGSSERYAAQYQRFHDVCSDSTALQQLIDLINKYRKCYDQEGYIG